MNWLDLQTKSIDEIFRWAESQTWAAEMSRCAQDGTWHAEGDVWTHTKLVGSELEKLDCWGMLDAHDKMVLIMTALFHDVAKPVVTQVDPETGKISSPKHAVRGEAMSRQILSDLQCDLKTREQITQLVRYHGRPVFLGEKKSPRNEVIQLSWLLSNRLLYLFSLADHRGRDSDSSDRSEDTLHYWKLLCEENDCYESRFQFANDAARVNFYWQSDPDLSYVPFENYPCKVTMVSGLPGAGKDTWLKQFRPCIPVVSLDVIRRKMGIDPTDNQGQVIQAAIERCREFLRAGTSFAFNATNLLQQTRSRWLRLFMDYQAYVEVIYLEPPLAKILKQNRQRSEIVPERVIRKLATNLQPPTWAECHHLTFVESNL